MNLKETISMMESTDYKERFKAEYYQLSFRLNDLKGMLIKWENNMLDFEPKCTKETLENQVIFMKGYVDILLLRAKIEEIELYYETIDTVKLRDLLETTRNLGRL